jgi:ferritin-like metal-binding protein YciE
MAIKTLEEKFQHGLGDIYDAEHRFLEAMQTMSATAESRTVLESLETHMAETEQQIVNLTRVYELLGLTPKRIACDAAKGLVSEGNKLLKETQDVPELADLGIVGSCSKVEHYEIAAYRGLIASAESVGQTEIARLLRENLQQEEKTAQLLETTMPTLLKQAVKTASQTA